MNHTYSVILGTWLLSWWLAPNKGDKWEWIDPSKYQLFFLGVSKLLPKNGSGFFEGNFRSLQRTDGSLKHGNMSNPAPSSQGAVLTLRDGEVTPCFPEPCKAPEMEGPRMSVLAKTLFPLKQKKGAQSSAPNPENPDPMEALRPCDFHTLSNIARFRGI